jgi:streptomycin 6-kinase
MLLERLGKNLGELGLSVANVLEAISATLQSFWRPLSGDAGLRTGAEHARWLSRYIADTDQALGGLCERAVIDRALELCDRRAASFDASRAVLVHGDAHVDVEGLCSEREHDLGVAMREYNAPLLQGDTRSLVRERAELLADRCAVDARKVWEWGFIERVSTGLANLRDFADDDGAMFLEVAARSI